MRSPPSSEIITFPSKKQKLASKADSNNTVQPKRDRSEAAEIREQRKAWDQLNKMKLLKSPSAKKLKNVKQSGSQIAKKPKMKDRQVKTQSKTLLIRGLRSQTQGRSLPQKDILKTKKNIAKISLFIDELCRALESPYP